MDDDELYSVGDFSKLTRTAESTLRHYDQIGLLEPVFRRGNRYRCYSIRQIAALNAIRTLQKVGASLAEIKELRDQRTPALAQKILSRQIDDLDAKVANINNAKQLLYTLLHSIQSGVSANTEVISVQFLPAEPLILGERNDYSNGQSDYGALFGFYKSMRERCSGWDLNYPVWALFSLEQIKQKQWKWPARYYFHNPRGQDQRPAALYAVGYTRTGYGMGEGLFERMLSYIERHSYTVCGDAYAEYPLNEICTADDRSYLMRLLITVREKERDSHDETAPLAK